MDAYGRPITHVFADIEGSTSLWESHAKSMADALSRHDETARMIVASFGGKIVKHTGDGWHAVFDDPLRALLAVHEYQRSLPAVGAAAGVALAVRCGIHTGVAQTRDGDYFGPAINRTARIANAAHGGQVLATQAVADLAQDRLPEHLVLRDLGRIRLRGVIGAIGVYQLDDAASPRDFPALRGLESTPNNLPLVANSFIGRAGALAELAHVLSSHRLVTLTGPGGVGKTRIALQLGAASLPHFDDGVWLVQLASLDGDAAVARAVAQVLGVREESGRPLIETIALSVHDRHALVILDNCEHVVAGCAAVAEAMLGGAEHVRIIATTREPLRIGGEFVYALPALPLPPQGAAAAVAATSPAVDLFVDRASEHATDFALTKDNAAAIASICRHLDGLPLAIELAAARVRSVAPEEIARRLSDRFALLTQGRRTALPRHRTLEALISWSFDLLDAREKQVIMRLGVFAGGFDLSAAEAVAAASSAELRDVPSVLGALVDKSLVVAETDERVTERRYRLLESIRHFAARALDAAGDTAQTQDRHAAYYAGLLGSLPDETQASAHGLHMARLDLELDNLRAALATYLKQGADAVVEYLERFTTYCDGRGMDSEASVALDAALALPIGAKPSALRARLLNDACFHAILHTRLDEALRWGEQALADYRLHGTPSNVASCLERLSEIASLRGNFHEALRLSEDALAMFHEAGGTINEGKVLVNLATTCLQACEFERARAYGERGAEIARATGHVGLQAFAELALGGIAIESDRVDEARAHYECMLPLARTLNDRLIEALARGGLAQVELARGNFRAAHAILVELLDWFARAGMRREVTYVLEDLATAFAQAGAPAAAGRVFAAAQGERGRARLLIPESERVRLRARIDKAREAGGAEFERAWSEGIGASLEEAIEFARATPLPPAQPAGAVSPATSHH